LQLVLVFFWNGMTSSPLASLATYFSTLFFPQDNPVAALLASLATFGVGMLVRPLGAALFGSLADKYGRRPVFIATIVLMGMATFGVGLLPTYAQAGMLAPALLLVLRLVAGICGRRRSRRLGSVSYRACAGRTSADFIPACCN